MEGDLWLVFEVNIIIRLFCEPFSVSSEAIIFCQSLLLGTNLPIDIYIYIYILLGILVPNSRDWHEKNGSRFLCT